MQSKIALAQTVRKIRSSAARDKMLNLAQHLRQPVTTHQLLGIKFC